MVHVCGSLNKSLCYFRTMGRIFIVTLALLLSARVISQTAVKDSLLFDPHISVGYAYQIPGGDMANRFGNNHNIGFGFHFKTRSSWYYGAQGSYIFGNKVNQEKGFLQNLKVEGGYILDNDGQLSKISIQERGFTAVLEGGRLFNIIGPNKNSGLLVLVGGGFLQHKIRIEHQESKIKQLEDDYLKGYDRLTNGPVLKEFIGYYHMSNNSFINFCIGIEAWQGTPQGRRDLNFDTQTTDNQKRNDVLIGLRFDWTLHLYKRMSDNYYYY